MNADDIKSLISEMTDVGYIGREATIETLLDFMGDELVVRFYAQNKSVFDDFAIDKAEGDI